MQRSRHPNVPGHAAVGCRTSPAPCHHASEWRLFDPVVALIAALQILVAEALLLTNLGLGQHSSRQCHEGMLPDVNANPSFSKALFAREAYEISRIRAIFSTRA